jgi:hypothetical protein
MPPAATKRLWNVLHNVDGPPLEMLVIKKQEPNPQMRSGTDLEGTREILDLHKFGPEDPLSLKFNCLELDTVYIVKAKVGRYRLGVQDILVGQTEQDAVYTIVFRQLSVKAQPKFGLYVADSPPALGRRSGPGRRASHFVANSGSPDPASRFLLNTDDALVRFFFWNLHWISAVLTDVGTGEVTETKVLTIPVAEAQEEEGYKIPERPSDPRLSKTPFQEITFKADRLLPQGPP